MRTEQLQRAGAHLVKRRTTADAALSTEGPGIRTSIIDSHFATRHQIARQRDAAGALIAKCDRVAMIEEVRSIRAVQPRLAAADVPAPAIGPVPGDRCCGAWGKNL